jgi:hypothetical protein
MGQPRTINGTSDIRPKILQSFALLAAMSVLQEFCQAEITTWF